MFSIFQLALNYLDNTSENINDDPSGKECLQIIESCFTWQFATTASNVIQYNMHYGYA